MKYLLCFLITFTSHAKLNVLTTTPELAYAAKVIGGDKASVESLLTGNEDPHYVDAMPRYVFKAANADIICSVGLGLELGWLPKVLQKSGNVKVQKGGKGFCETGAKVSALDKKEGNVDRSLGDVHPEGNPHFHFSPKAYLEASEAILDSYLATDSENAQNYLKNFELLKKEVGELEKEAMPFIEKIKGQPFMEYHKSFSYFFNHFNLNNIGSVETVSGVPPSAGQLVRSAMRAKDKKVTAVIASHVAPSDVLKKFKEFSKVKVIKVPLGMKKSSSKTYKEFYLSFLKEITK